MAISTRRQNDPLWRRLWRAYKTKPTDGYVRSKDEFQCELAKEISRSNRRQQDREFALIHLTSINPSQELVVGESLVESFVKRVRISDTIGWHSSKLAVLLPETDRIGAGLVANDLVKLAERYGSNLDSAIYVYPWDDRLISVSNEIAQAASQHSNPNDDDSSRSDSHLNELSTRVDVGQSPLHSNEKQAGHRVGQRNGFASDRSKSESGLSGARHQSDAVGVLDLIDEADSIASLTARPTSAANRPAEAPTVTTAELEDRPLLAVSAPTPWWKRSIDIIGSGAGLVVLSPILIGAAVAIRLTSSGPVLFRQRREGKDGRPFDILKFRTMVVDAESKQAELRGVSEQDGPAFKLKNDPRITGTGKFLRKSCIDELPQLVNILKGQMSLVGPRPLPVGESTACGPWQRMRLTVLPGLTCIWQARGGRKVSFDQWMRMDLEYIETRSFKNDMKLIFETACIALMQRGSV